MNSRAKGCRGEREFRDILREAGFLKAYRTMQYCGRNPQGGDCDVTCPELPMFHFEVKRVERGNLYDWIAQAIRDAGTWFDKTPLTAARPGMAPPVIGKLRKIPVVAHKKNNSEWLAILPMERFLEIVRRSDLVTRDNNGNQGGQ
jgi:hypothetical protein